jgi:hypothetical protein
MHTFLQASHFLTPTPFGISLRQLQGVLEYYLQGIKMTQELIDFKIKVFAQTTRRN